MRWLGEEYGTWDAYQCPVCRSYDTSEQIGGHEVCLECAAIDGEPVSEEEQAHMAALYARISSAEPDPPSVYTTETSL